MTDGTQFVLDNVDNALSREDLAQELEKQGLVLTTTDNDGNIHIVNSDNQPQEVNNITRGALASTGASVTSLAAMALLSLIGAAVVFTTRNRRKQKPAK